MQTKPDVAYERFLHAVGAMLAFNEYAAADIDEFTERHGLGLRATTLAQMGWAHVLRRQRLGHYQRPHAPTITLAHQRVSQ